MARRPLALAAALVAAGCALLAWAGADPALARAPATLLAPPIPEAVRTGQARGVFYTATLDLDLPAQVRLSGTPEGSGELCTDDEAELRFERRGGADQHWRHHFATADRQGIECVAAQTITLAAGPGRYTVAISLTDRFADTFSSTSYYLLAEPAATAQALTDDRRPPSDDRPPADQGAPAAAQRPPADQGRPTTAQRPPTAPSIAVIRADLSAPTGEPASALPGTSGAAAEPPATPRLIWPLFPIGVGIGLALLALILIRRRPKATPRLHGIIDLVDRETGESRTLLLHKHPRGVAIVRRPLDLVPLGKAGGEPTAIATIIPGPHGPLLEYQDLAEGRRRAPLSGGDHLLIQRAVEVRYRQAR